MIRGPSRLVFAATWSFTFLTMPLKSSLHHCCPSHRSRFFAAHQLSAVLVDALFASMHRS
jgi:hypothetical protein